jgi:transposase
MPRPSLDLDSYQEKITELINSNYTNEDIRVFLLNTYGISTSANTIRRRRDAWGLRTPRAYLLKGTPDEITRNQVVYDLLQLSLSTDEILLILQKMGIPSSERSLYRIRQKLGVRLRVNDATERIAQERDIEKILSAEDEIGEIDGYGRRLQQIHLRSQGVFIAR